MENILVTGATGFIGNYVVPELLRTGAGVVATSSDPEKAKTFGWYGNVRYKPFDLRSTSFSDNLYEYFERPTRIIHLAWEGLPDYRSLFHFEENLPRHYLFLKNMVLNGCRNVTVTGTCFEYGMQSGMLSEEMPADPDNAYGLAKYTLYRFLRELSKKETFPLKWARLFYMFGKGQNPRSLFSQLDKALDNNEAVFNMSGGEQVRDFLPVQTVAEYIVKIALQDNTSGVINCCSGKPVKVKDLVHEYLRSKNREIKLNPGYYPYPDYEPMAFWGDNKKLQTILNEQ